MAKEEKSGSVKRFGARYGRRIKERFAKIEHEQRKRQKCPYCSAQKVKRIAAGIWGCRKCGVKFSGRAYTLSKKAVGGNKIENISPGEISMTPDSTRQETDNLEEE
ncbi:50S ribosomal protein L37ae [Candidatus Woesearchaeota archaeon]|nr:50S ribosomal protein L37ae [Candidatus Woesearchaeota archaeon]